MDIEFLRQAIQLSRQSFEQGNFPAGAVVAKDGQVFEMCILPFQKSKVSGDYYETASNLSHLAATFNEPVRLHHVPE